MASVDDSGIEDQNAPLEAEVAGGVEEYDPAMVCALTGAAPMLRTSFT